MFGANINITSKLNSIETMSFFLKTLCVILFLDTILVLSMNKSLVNIEADAMLQLITVPNIALSILIYSSFMIFVVPFGQLVFYPLVLVYFYIFDYKDMLLGVEKFRYYAVSNSNMAAHAEFMRLKTDAVEWASQVNSSRNALLLITFNLYLAKLGDTSLVSHYLLMESDVVWFFRFSFGTIFLVLAFVSIVPCPTAFNLVVRDPLLRAEIEDHYENRQSFIRSQKSTF